MQFAEKKILLRDGRECLLRSPGPEDAAALVEYLRQTSGETPYMIRFPEEVTLTEEQEAEFLAGQLEAPGCMMIGAFVAGQLAANAGINPVIQRKKTMHRAQFGIAVKKAWWGLGIGGALVEECLRSAALLGYEQLELDVFAGNERARRLYAAKGFQETGRIPRAFRLSEDHYEDGIFMVKLLKKQDALLP